uniref:Uncharacterized protein n=1 Tax=Wuchereria bancrofti TaxID=6293 RepID=A0A1I8EJH4_WUCBA
MRHHKRMYELFVLLIFVVLPNGFVCQALKNNKLAFAKLFHTEQFLFVALSNCHLIVEEISSMNACSYVNTIRMSAISNQSNCSDLRLHLILRDNEVPKVLILGAKKVFGNLIAQQLQIPWPRQKRIFTNVSEKTYVNLESSYNHIGDNLLQKQVVATLVDNKERILYVLRNLTLAEDHFTLECIRFYMQFMPNGRLNFYELNAFRNIHSNNNIRILWTEDPYHRKFYYVEKQADNEFILYSFPYESIMQILLSGKQGTPVQTFEGVNLRYLSVSRDIAVIHTIEGKNAKQLITNLYGQSSLTITCNMRKSVSSNLSGAIVLFDDELCALQEANDNNCTKMNKSIIDKQYQSWSMHSLFYGFIVLILLLLLILIQLLICLYWHRSMVEQSLTIDNCSLTQCMKFPTGRNLNIEVYALIDLLTSRLIGLND